MPGIIKYIATDKYLGRSHVCNTGYNTSLNQREI